MQKHTQVLTIFALSTLFGCGVGNTSGGNPAARNGDSNHGDSTINQGDAIAGSGDASTPGDTVSTPGDTTQNPGDINTNPGDSNLNTGDSTLAGDWDQNLGGNAIGINISGNIDWQAARTFADAMMSHRFDRWEALDVNGNPMGVEPSRDADGWPLEDAEVILWHTNERMHGTYGLRFEGQATVVPRWGSSTVNNQVYDEASNTTTGELVYTPTTGDGLKLGFRQTNGGVRNVKLMRPLTPGATQYHDFDTLFSAATLEQLQRFQVIRYLDFVGTNSNSHRVWSDRVLPGDASQAQAHTNYGWAGKGTAYEYGVMLANEAQVDVWFTTPALADDDFITKLAQLLRHGSDGVLPYTSPQANPLYPPVDPGLRIYIEYSNELWNSASAFRQFHDNQDAASAEVASGNSPLNYDGETNQYYWGHRRVGKRLVEISKIFRQVFGDAQMMTRIRPVLMNQQNDANITLSLALNFVDGYYNNGGGNYVADPHPPNYFFYGAGGSAYYGPGNPTPIFDINNIWETGTFDNANWADRLVNDINLAAAFGLKRIAYEGGPSLDHGVVGDDIREQAWGDDRITTKIVGHHDIWSNYGGDLLVYFKLAARGDGFFRWGFTDNIYDLHTPKLLGINALNSQPRAPVTYGNDVPFTLDGRQFHVSSVRWRSPGTGSLGLDAGENSASRWASYTFKRSGEGSNTVRINYSANDTAQLDIFVHGDLLDSIAIDAATNADTPNLATAILPPGIDAVLLRCSSGAITINSVTVE